jgi:hypothetical protein
VEKSGRKGYITERNGRHYGSQGLQPDDAVESNTVTNCVNQSYLLIPYCRIQFSKFSVKICCIKYYYCKV